ncbi:MAG TPA: hypothetical protein VIA18_27160 [Polyangia bacterium]|nr:hypothetical protein [Polyangia bacterium]
MKVRIWNAYASNNSGSYTIVGLLPSQEVAQSVAVELEALIAAHSQWLATDDPSAGAEDSPLAAFCRANDLHWEPAFGDSEDWPNFGDGAPRVVAAGPQVIVHSHFTLSLPPTFGEYFYRRGGRVQTEENHAHAPIVVIAEFWWIDRQRQAVELPNLIAALTDADGPLVPPATHTWPAAWRASTERGEAPFTVGAVFNEPIDSVAVLRDLATRAGARMTLKLYEADDETHDPLASRRASEANAGTE